MFEARLRISLFVLGVVLLLLVGRLMELQLVHGSEYSRRAERAAIQRPTRLPFVRGRILDRAGAVLLHEEPCWDLRVDFRVIAAEFEGDPRAIRRAADSTGGSTPFVAMAREVKRWKRAKRYAKAAGDQQIARGLTDEDVERALRDELARMWREIAARFASERAPLTAEMLRDRAIDIYNRVTRVRLAVARRRGYDAPVAEEREKHAVVTGLDAQEQVLARESLTRYPWVYVVPSSMRTFVGDATPFAHVLGRTGRVDATHVANDPNADDPFARYRADEQVGISGVEYAAERILRGRRGQLVRDRQENVVAKECIEAQEGRDAILTLHAELQRRLYRVLGDAVRAIPASSGGAIVVLEVPTREVLALVSFPSYEPDRVNERYPVLRDDTEHLPLRFRAVASRYPPGSIVKPLVCLKGLTSGRIGLHTRETCNGYLLDDQPDKWRCWQLRGTQLRKRHGSIDVVEALKGSCNVFLYRLGERLGVDALCDAFHMVGIGRPAGTGLREEARGINPTPDWLLGVKNTPVHPAHARLFAIGQGEISVTPLQAANLMATYASGAYRPVSLITPADPTPEWTGLASASQWAAVRSGMYQVVNDPQGTAYKYARFDHDRYVLCGKTGSATAYPWPTSYRVPFTDAKGEQQIAVVRAGARARAVARFAAEHPEATFDRNDAEVASRWPVNPPPEGGNHAHAWFAGFLQAVDAAHQPDWSVPSRVAFAVLVEFGGSGGRTAGPIARRVAAEILDVLGPDLNIEPVLSTHVQR